jgi:LPXTG-site transpeptidase (sortase) family protein
MTDTRTTVRKSHKKWNWTRWAGNLLLIAGMLLLVGSSLARVKIILAAELQASRALLVSGANLSAFLPVNIGFKAPLAPATGLEATIPTPQLAEPGNEPTPEPPLIVDPYPSILPESEPILEPVPPPVESQGSNPGTEVEEEPLFSFATPPMGEASLTVDKPTRPEQGGLSQVYLPMIWGGNPEVEVHEGFPVIDPVNGGTVVIPQPNPGAGPIIRVVIPSLNIERAVIPVGLKRDSGKQLTWNTDVLFSTNNRSDLIGQASTSVNPGEGGNIILIGHNYNNGWYSPAGVFVNLAKIQPGSKIQVTTRDGGDFTYEVKLVKKVPWQKQNSAELEKHHKYLWPTENEQLTLVTCGGANFGVWSARIYVVAVPLR